MMPWAHPASSRDESAKVRSSLFHFEAFNRSVYMVDNIYEATSVICSVLRRTRVLGSTTTTWGQGRGRRLDSTFTRIHWHRLLTSYSPYSATMMISLAQQIRKELVMVRGWLYKNRVPSDYITSPEDINPSSTPFFSLKDLP